MPALLAALIAGPLPARAQPAPAADSVTAWQAMLAGARGLPEAEQLQAVNRFFNRRLQFDSDVQTWQQADYWATPREFLARGRGDCEDFAIAKYVSLRLLGIDEDRLRLMHVRAQAGGSGTVAHMVLGVLPAAPGEPLILDNLIDSLRPASLRSDLTPVYSFNRTGLWAGADRAVAVDPLARLSRWRELLQRMAGEGLTALALASPTPATLLAMDRPR